jgi:hypothetical protein
MPSLSCAAGKFDAVYKNLCKNTAKLDDYALALVMEVTSSCDSRVLQCAFTRGDDVRSQLEGTAELSQRRPPQKALNTDQSNASEM